MQILEPLHKILTQLSLKLENLATAKSDTSSEKCSRSMSISFKLSKIELFVFDGNPSKWQESFAP